MTYIAFYDIYSNNQCKLNTSVVINKNDSLYISYIELTLI